MALKTVVFLVPLEVDGFVELCEFRHLRFQGFSLIGVFFQRCESLLMAVLKILPSFGRLDIALDHLVMNLLNLCFSVFRTLTTLSHVVPCINHCFLQLHDLASQGRLLCSLLIKTLHELVHLICQLNYHLLFLIFNLPFTLFLII